MSLLKRFAQASVAIMALTFVAGCAHSPPSNPQDPFESVNRGVYKFNDTLDRYALRPVAKGYRAITPDPVERSIGNFFNNLFYPTTIINSYLQAKFHNGTSDVARFIVNSTLGIAGLFDVATGLGLPEHDEDFGQTLGYWGVGQGVYLMLPLLGPTTGRDGIGRIGDSFTNPLAYVGEIDSLSNLEALTIQLSLQALYLIDLRAGLLGFDQNIRNAFDPYLFVRGAYLERRLNLVHDGDPPAELRDENYDFEPE